MSFGVYVKDKDFDQAYAWCVETFGDEYDDGWYVDIEPLLQEEFIFNNKEWATLFMLRWT